MSGPGARRQPTACLRLSRGSSLQATWLLEDVPGGTTIRVGADSACDWQIRAACVPDHALTVMLIGGTLFMKSSQEGGVLLDGRQLPAQWTEVASGSRLDIGLSRIEIALGEAASAFEHLPQAYVPVPSYQQRPNLPHTSMPTMEYRLDQQDIEGVYVDSVATGPDQAKTQATFAELTADQQATRASIMPRIGVAREAPGESERASFVDRGRPSLLERLSRPSLMGGPNLLDDGSQPSSGPTLKKLAIGGLATAVAYAGWLMLLDRL